MKRTQFISLLLAAVQDRTVLDFATVDTFDNLSSLEFMNVIRAAKENGISDNELIAIADEHYSRLEGDMQALHVGILENKVELLQAQLESEEAQHHLTVCNNKLSVLKLELEVVDVRHSLRLSDASHTLEVEELQDKLVEMKSAKADVFVTAVMLFASVLVLLPVGGMFCYYQGVNAGQSQQR